MQVTKILSGMTLFDGPQLLVRDRIQLTQWAKNIAKRLANLVGRNFSKENFSKENFSNFSEILQKSTKEVRERVGKPRAQVIGIEGA